MSPELDKVRDPIQAYRRWKETGRHTNVELHRLYNSKMREITNEDYDNNKVIIPKYGLECRLNIRI